MNSLIQEIITEPITYGYLRPPGDTVAFMRKQQKVSSLVTYQYLDRCCNKHARGAVDYHENLHSRKVQWCLGVERTSSLTHLPNVLLSTHVKWLSLYCVKDVSCAKLTTLRLAFTSEIELV